MSAIHSDKPTRAEATVKSKRKLSAPREMKLSDSISRKPNAVLNADTTAMAKMA